MALHTPWFTVKSPDGRHRFTGYNTLDAPSTAPQGSAITVFGQAVGQTRNLCYPVQIRYLAEVNLYPRLRSMMLMQLKGAANFVFELLPPTEIGFLPEEIKGKLLRIRKSEPANMSTAQSWRAYNDRFLPLLGRENVVEYELVDIDGSMHNLCMMELQRAGEDGRRENKSETGIDFEDEFGLLMPNMKISLDIGLSGEFKPKWLRQSHDAPVEATRCRTCAMTASRGKDLSFCPLKLASEEEGERADAISGIVQELNKRWARNPWDPTLDLLKRHRLPDDIQSRLENFFSHEGRGLILRLEQLQTEWDTTGLPVGDPDPNFAKVDPDYPLAMTLRDCTIFLKIPKTAGEPIEARLGDLDMKSPQKFLQWYRKEQELVNGGWYTMRDVFRKHCLLAKTIP
ncbi:MAG: hypothetical protein Q9165_007214 [Trypethelium subeluteriae]